MKKFMNLFLVLAMVFSLSVPVFAAAKCPNCDNILAPTCEIGIDALGNEFQITCFCESCGIIGYDSDGNTCFPEDYCYACQCYILEGQTHDCPFSGSSFNIKCPNCDVRMTPNLSNGVDVLGNEIRFIYGCDLCGALGYVKGDGLYVPEYCSDCACYILEGQSHKSGCSTLNSGSTPSSGNDTTITYVGTGTEAYEITVPSGLNPGGSGTVTATGTWATNRKLTVTTNNTVTVTNDIDGGTKVLDVTFAGIDKAGDNEVEVTVSKSISVGDITDALFGTWSGSIIYSVSMVDNN